MTRSVSPLSALLRFAFLVALLLFLLGSVAMLGYFSIRDGQHGAQQQEVEPLKTH